MKALATIFFTIFLTIGFYSKAYSFSFTNKNFKSWDECKNFVIQSSNDEIIRFISLLYGCDNLNERPTKVFLPDGKQIEIYVKNRTDKQIIEFIINDYWGSFKSYLPSVYLPNGTKLLNVPKNVLPSQVWNQYCNDESTKAMCSIFYTWSPHQQSKKFGVCLINGLEKLSTSKTKYDRILSCGEKSGLPRSTYLSMADYFSDDKRQSNQAGQNNLLNILRNDTNCVFIGGDLPNGILPIIRCN